MLAAADTAADMPDQKRAHQCTGCRESQPTQDAGSLETGPQHRRSAADRLKGARVTEEQRTKVLRAARDLSWG